MTARSLVAQLLVLAIVCHVAMTLKDGQCPAAPELKPRDVFREALSSLENIRTPSTLIAGASLGAIFVNFEPGCSRRLSLLYIILTAVTFSMCLVCVLTATATYTALMARGHAVGTTAVSFLMDCYELEFLVVRCSFGLGLLCFSGAMVTRGWLALGPSAHRAAAGWVTVIVGVAASFCLSMVDMHSGPLMPSLGDMILRIMYLTTQQLFDYNRAIRHAIFVLLAWAACKWWISDEQPCQPAVQVSDKTKSA